MSRRVRPIVTAMFAVALLAGACTDDGGGTAGGDSTGTTGTPGPGDPVRLPAAEPLEFDDCTNVVAPQIKDRPGAERNLSFGCGTLKVPLDYADPGGAKLDIYVTRVRIGDQGDRIGSLVINPGGPGGSGLNAAVGLALSLPTELLSRFDLVGFDPRGVGVSEPVRCLSDKQKDDLVAADVDAPTPGALQREVDRATELSQTCWDKYRDRLGHFNTTDTARDLDQLRESLGDEDLTYLGYSYGTLLGAVYAELFPQNVRALALDGAIDPTAGMLERGETSAAGFEDAFDQFAAACRAQGTRCPIGPDARGFVTRLLAQARKAPIPSSREGETRRATPGNVHLAVIAALYDQEQWSDLAHALSQASKGDAQGVFAIGDAYYVRDEEGRYTNLVDANLAITCNDYTDEVSTNLVAAKLGEWRTKYPLFGTASALGMLNCRDWQPERTPLPSIDAAGAPSILVVGTSHDPATPYADAQDLAGQLTSGVLLTWEGEGHTAYPKTPCVASAVDDYLIDLVVPKDGLSCPPK